MGHFFGILFWDNFRREEVGGRFGAARNSGHRQAPIGGFTGAQNILSTDDDVSDILPEDNKRFLGDSNSTGSLT